jgi:sialidase-1
VILATVEARRGSGGDWDGNDVLLRRSQDGGITWQEPQKVASCDDYGPGPISNFVMIADRSDKSVHAIYCHNYERLFYMRSHDDGASFSAPREITESMEHFRNAYPWRVIATGPGHGIELENGRLVVPVWMSTGEGTEFGAGKLGHRPSVVASIYSDDQGQSWHCGDLVVSHGEQVRNPSETIPVQLSDGRVLFNVRSESAQNRRWIATSPDGAHDWQVVGWDEALLEPVCMASILKLSQKSEQGKNWIVFANPDNLENELIPPRGNLAHDRKRLSVKLSPDDCRTWNYSRVLEAGPSGYSDLAQAPDGAVLCIYEDGMLERMTDTRAVSVARFDLDWVIAGA